MDKLPYVSIVIRTVDRPQQLRRALESVALQTYPNVEAVIVNDGGKTVVPVLETIGLKLRATLIELPSRIGRSACANLGIERAEGEYLGFLDDDDILYPFHIERLFTALALGEFRVAYSDAVRALQVPSPIDPAAYLTTELKLCYSEEAELNKLVHTNFIPILTVLFARECVKDVRFDTNLEVLEDWDFWIQLRSRFEFKHLQEITAEYSYRIDQTNTTGQREELWEWSRAYIARKYRGLRESIANGVSHG